MPTDPPTPHSEHDLDYGPTLRGLREGTKVFKRYTLKRKLGQGGMGVVWLALDERLDLEVALKFLPEHLAHDEAALDDLRRETRRCMKLNHPHIVRVYDLVEGGENDTAAIAMEYVEGKSLTGLRLEKPNRMFEAEDISIWVRQVCEALDYAHTEGKVVHRDLKPANLMVDARGRVRVMDFGIASSIGDSLSRLSKASQARSGGGTLPYMSPQQLMGFPPSVSDDVYSLGATIYELLTSKPPFFRGGETGISRQIESQTPPAIVERRNELEVSLPVALHWEEVVAACLSKESDKRPRTALEVWSGLNAPAHAPPPPPAPAIKPRPVPQVAVGSASASLPSQGAVGKPWVYDLGQGAKLSMCYCQPGSFMMGSSTMEEKRSANENQILVKISQGFWLSQTECSQSLWQAVYGTSSNSSYFKGKDLPMENLNWHQAQEFMNALNGRIQLPAGWHFALPTEAQWEYACRAGTRVAFHFGNSLSSEQANFNGNIPYGAAPRGPVLNKTNRVGLYTSNSWGFHDMHGNVSEWCADWYADELAGGTDPSGPKSGAQRVIRGGSWSSLGSGCRSAARHKAAPGFFSNILGFRIAAVRIV